MFGRTACAPPRATTAAAARDMHAACGARAERRIRKRRRAAACTMTQCARRHPLRGSPRRRQPECAKRRARAASPEPIARWASKGSSGRRLHVPAGWRRMRRQRSRARHATPRAPWSAAQVRDLPRASCTRLPPRGRRAARIGVPSDGRIDGCAAPPRLQGAPQWFQRGNIAQKAAHAVTGMPGRATATQAPHLPTHPSVKSRPVQPARRAAAHGAVSLRVPCSVGRHSLRRRHSTTLQAANTQRRSKQAGSAACRPVAGTSRRTSLESAHTARVGGRHAATHGGRACQVAAPRLSDAGSKVSCRASAGMPQRARPPTAEAPTAGRGAPAGRHCSTAPKLHDAQVPERAVGGAKGNGDSALRARDAVTSPSRRPRKQKLLRAAATSMRAHARRWRGLACQRRRRQVCGGRHM